MVFVAVVFACLGGQCQFLIEDKPPFERSGACETRLAEMLEELAAAIPGIQSRGICLPVKVVGV